MKQLIFSDKKCFGTSSERMDTENQICFFEENGNIVFFNESESVCNLKIEEHTELETKPSRKKKYTIKEDDISSLPVNVIISKYS